MELTDVKATWAELDRRLSARLAAERTIALGRTRSEGAVRRVQRVLWVELAVNLLLALLTGSYLADHVGTLRLALPAAALHLTAISLVVAAVAQLVALGRLDFAEPVVALQRRLEKLRVLRTRVHRWLLVSSALLWTPLAIVGADALWGFDVYRAFGWPWIAANLAFGLAVIAVAIVASRRWAHRMRPGLARTLADVLAGHTLARAVASVEDLAAFEAGLGGE